MTGDIRTDRFGRYWAPDPVTGEEKAFTRATTWAKTISDTYGLQAWRERQVARGVAMREDLQALAAALPDSEKKQLNQVVQQAVDHAAPSAGANVGTALHSWTAQLDSGEAALTIPEAWRADVTAYGATLSKYSIHTIPSLVERYACMTHPMDVAGQFDRIVEWDGGWYIADVKTQASLDYSWGEIAVQLALYANAEHLWYSPVDPEDEAGWTLMPAVNKEQGLVIHLPAKQARCELWWVDLELGWKAAMLAMEVREWRKRKDIARPFGVDLLGRSPVRLTESIALPDNRSSGVGHKGNSRSTSATPRGDNGATTSSGTTGADPASDVSSTGDSPARAAGDGDGSRRSPHQPVTGSTVPTGEQDKLDV